MTKPIRVCAEPTCPQLTRSTRCPTHQRAHHQAITHPRPTTTQRGYGWAHQKAAAQQITHQPWCTYCHQTRGQVESRGDQLTAHHLLNSDGSRVHPPRYTTACGHCNTSIGGTNRQQHNQAGHPGG